MSQSRLSGVPISILDRANNREGSTPAEALAAVIARARRAEELGYHRFWVAEHHAVPGIAGSTPTLLMAAIAGRTERIRVGSGGVMLPNHQPLVVAEQAATLQALFPGRIDLGLGRSVAFTSAIRAALRQGKDAAERFGDDLAELLSYLDGTAAITARPPDRGATRPFVLAMGRGQEYAARAGLGVVVGGPAFTGNSPGAATNALQRYRDEFRPSAWYAEPYVIVSANVAIADTAEQARDLLLPEAWAMTASRTIGDFPPLVSVADIRARTLTPRQETMLEEYLTATIHGTADQVADRLATLLERTGAAELLVTTNTYDTGALAELDRRLVELFRP
ncbi:MsnO8 family LLM class oxidoreductase [Granulicoccus phenolivorans]|uniref:MsnO8 family LLM class oxidoreductase n=1 Tax=Granulicoccus phenolivorans TaxID=266854 RepID=UPI0003F63D20|nr:MsnO8 family LLM class oxidoreductase [Granulicoccus phenolivorans]